MTELERLPLSGQTYSAPATRWTSPSAASMAINGLLGICDQEMDYLPFGVFHLDCRRPHLAHWASADNTCGTKVLESIPLLRLMSGSQQHLDTEKGMREAFAKRIQEGHFWDVVRSPPAVAEYLQRFGEASARARMKIFPCRSRPGG